MRDFTYEELHHLSLLKSNEKIPTFQEFLELIDGQVPLIVEIKIHENATEVCSRVDELLRDYKGVYCIESFHPFALIWYKKNRPEVVRGQLSSDFRKDGEGTKIEYWMVKNLLTNFLAKPDFIAYNHKYKNGWSLNICKKWFGLLTVAWTIKSQKELEEARETFSLFIFEGFLPKK